MDGTAALVATDDLTIVMDHSQFYVHGSETGMVSELVEDALESPEKIAGDGTTVVVITPIEFNSRMPVRIEVWDGRPVDNPSEWERINTTKLSVDSGVIQLGSTGGGLQATPVPNGNFVIEIAGRGLTDSPEFPEPPDEWRVRLWPDVSTAPTANLHFVNRRVR